MERTFLSWNIENWITVVLMAALGYLVFALFAQFVVPRLPSAPSLSGG